MQIFKGIYIYIHKLSTPASQKAKQLSQQTAKGKSKTACNTVAEDQVQKMSSREDQVEVG